jgi:DNA adenine methylase
MVVGGSDFIRELYDGYIKFEYPKNYAFKIHSGRVSDEINVNHLVITNYEIE